MLETIANDPFATIESEESEATALELTDHAKFGIPEDVLLPVAEIGGHQFFTTDEIVHLGVYLLAGNDPDFAGTRNDIGFNKIHARVGHALAEKPLEKWTEYELYAARKMLETYKNTQLRFLWPYMPALPAQPPRRIEGWERTQRYQPEEQYRRLTIEQRNGEYVCVIEQNYDAALVNEIKRLPQRRYDAEKKQWYVPMQLDVLEPLLDFAVTNGYDIPENVQVVVGEVIAHFQNALEMSRAADVDIDLDLPDGLELFPFQKAGVAYMQAHGNALCADQPGLGKTIQALAVAALDDQWPILVVCPASIKRNWEREAKKWLPGKRVRVLDGRMNPLRFMGGDCLYDVLIINYNSTILGKWLPYLTEVEPKLIVLDEVHAIKNPKAQQTKLIEQLRGDNPSARVIALSGTPVVNRPMEFWQIVKILGQAKNMGGYSNYKRRYDTSDQERLEELNVRARTYFMVRRLKADVLKELPPKMYSVVPLELTNRTQYDVAERNIAGYFATKKSESADFIQQARNMAQASGLDAAMTEAFIRQAQKERYNAAYLIAAQSEQLLRWEALKQLAVRGKMEAVLDWIDDFLDTGEKLVVFVTHTEVGQRIATKFNAPFIHGGVDPDKRMPMVDQFQNDPGCRLIVGNMIAMGEGLTLTAASNVAFIEFGWNPKQHEQAEDRCHRIGQDDNVTVYHLIASDTIEEEIVALIEAKRGVVNAIQDGAEEATQRQMFADLEQRLSARLNRKG